MDHGLGGVPTLDAVASADTARPGTSLCHDLLRAPLAAPRRECLEVEADPHLHWVKPEALAELFLDPEPFRDCLQAQPVGPLHNFTLGGAFAIPLFDVLH